MNKIRIHHGKEFEAFELQTDEIPCKLIAAVFYQKNDEHRLVLAEAEKYASLFAAAPALLEACKEVRLMLNTDLKDYKTEPWAMRVEAAIAQAEKEG